MRALTVMAVVLGAVLAGGCTTLKPALVTKCKMPWNARPNHDGAPALVGLEYGEHASPIPLDSVQFSSMDAATSLSIQRLSAVRTPTNTVEVAARFISCEDKPFAVRVRTSFMDAAQAPTEQASGWQTIYLQPHLTAAYSERSTSTKVANYLIEIMPQ